MSWALRTLLYVRIESLQHPEQVLLTAHFKTYPLQKKYQTHEYLRTMPHLRPRIPFNFLMLRFRSQCIAQLTRYLMTRDFIQTHPPIITSSDCEGAGEVFNVSTGASEPSPAPPTSCNDRENDGSGFFRSPKYLTVSSQMHLEALAQAVGKVWTLSPTFRAEKSDTSRHLSEFYMLEAEVNFADGLEVIMELVEDILRDLTTSMYNDPIASEIIQRRNLPGGGAQTAPDPISTELESRWHGMMSGNWPRITYTDAIDLLRRCGQTFEHTPMWGRGLQAEHERFIATNVGKGMPVFVTHYPQKVKPFYMLATSNSKPRQQTVDCFDLLVQESCEIAGGSMREHQLDSILNVMVKKGIIPIQPMKGQPSVTLDIVPDNLKWYIDLRRWGSVPHGGFGLGFDRLLAYLAGISNIREVVAFPRWVGRCDC
jgi:asparaginyl-tRNA synthetase